MEDRCQITGGFCLVILWFAAVNGWKVLALVLAAAAIHETGHYLALRLLGGRVKMLRLTLFDAAPLGAYSGPLALLWPISFLLLLTSYVSDLLLWQEE